VIDAEVKRIDWSDEYSDDVDTPAMLALTAGIGEKGQESADNFQVIACNPAWIANRISECSGFWPRGMLVVKKIDPTHIRIALQKLTDQFQGSNDWTQFTERMNRYLLWEFEDYNDYQGSPEVPNDTVFDVC